MEKVKIKIKINAYNIEGIGSLNKNILKIKDKEDTIYFNLDLKALIKQNKDLKIVLDFENKLVTYELIKEKQKFSNILRVKLLTISDKQVMINYQIEEESFCLKINYETI